MSLQPEDVQSYPRPAIAEPVPQRIEIAFAGEIIVDTTRAIRVLETHHAPSYYIPPHDIRARLTPASGRSFCEWKGMARYFDLSVGDHRAQRAAWCYDAPTASFACLAGYVAFYAGKLDRCSVGGLEVIAQAGDFYGGWVTPNLRGIVKGAPGTEHW